MRPGRAGGIATSHWLEAPQPLLGKKKTELRMLQVERGAYIQGYSQWVEPQKESLRVFAGRDLGRDSICPGGSTIPLIYRVQGGIFQGRHRQPPSLFPCTGRLVVTGEGNQCHDISPSLCRSTETTLAKHLPSLDYLLWVQISPYSHWSLQPEELSKSLQFP